MNMVEARNVIEVIREKAMEGITPANGHEAYSRMLELNERADKAGKGMKKLLEEYWDAVKEKDGSAMMAYAKEIERQATLTAACYVSLAADAQLASDVDC